MPHRRVGMYEQRQEKCVCFFGQKSSLFWEKPGQNQRIYAAHCF